MTHRKNPWRVKPAGLQVKYLFIYQSISLFILFSLKKAEEKMNNLLVLISPRVYSRGALSSGFVLCKYKVKLSVYQIDG